MTVSAQQSNNNRLLLYESRLDNSVANFIKVYEPYYTNLHGKTKGVPLAKAAAIIKSIVEWVKTEGISLKKYQFFEDISEILKAKGFTHLPKNHRRLREKIEQIVVAEQSIEDVIKLPREGNKNAARFNDVEIEAFILVMRMSGNNYTNSHIIRRISLVAQLCEKAIPSESWFNAYLAKNETKTLTAVQRFGSKSRHAQVFKGYNPIQRAVFAGDAWQLDGTRSQLIPWKDKDNKDHYAYEVIVRDVMSGAIIGVSIGEKESHLMYVHALRMAAQMTGYLPYEIVFDRFPGHNTDEWKAIQKRIEMLGIKVTYTSTATGKAQTERWFGTKQTVFSQQSLWYYGEGIMSSRPFAHRSSDKLKEMRKNAKNVDWGFDKACNEAEMIMARYNATPLSSYSKKYKGIDKTPLELHHESDKPNVVKLEPYQIIRLFGLQKSVTIRSNMIRTEINSGEYFFAVNDMFTLTHYTKVSIAYDLNDLRKVFVFSPDGERFLCEADEQKTILVHGPNADWEALAKSKKRNKDIENAKKQMLLDKLAPLSNRGSEVDLLMGGYVPKEDLLNAEMSFLTEGNTDSEPVILGIEETEHRGAFNTDIEFDAAAYGLNQL